MQPSKDEISSGDNGKQNSKLRHNASGSSNTATGDQQQRMKKQS